VYKVAMVRLALLAVAVLAGVTSTAQAQLLTLDHPGQYNQEDIARGSLLYAAQCVHCHGRDGDLISGIDLRRGLLRRSQSDEDVAQTITRGTPGGMPPFKLDAAELTGIIAYIRAGFDTSASVRVGDAARGRMVFEGKGECATCHRVAGKGPRSAPDLSDIGIARAPAVLERSVRDPSSALMPINRPVRIVTRDGRTIRGRRLNEDTHTVQIIDDRERLLSIVKKDVRSYEVTTESLMPAYAGKLTDGEIADVIAYLLTLRRQ
jgi:putative heme-binding domain-containing protein